MVGRTRRAVRDYARLVIDHVVFAEVSVGFTSIETLDKKLPRSLYERAHLPWAARFSPAKPSWSTEEQAARERSPLPDFYIGAHAAVTGMSLLTRDAARYRTYFPTVELITPDT